MIKRFLISYWSIWSIIYLLDSILPAQSFFDLKLEVMILNLSYLFVSSIAAILLTQLFDQNRTTSQISYKLESRGITSILFVLKIISIVGALSFLYDKAVVQGIDYTQGIASGRYQLQANRTGAQGVSSVASVFGYILGAASFILLFLSYLFFENLSKYQRWSGIIISILVVGLVSFLTGGRTSVILIFGVILGGGVLRRFLGYKFHPFRKVEMVIASLLVVISFSYLVYVFQSRANANSRLADAYAIAMINHMNGEPTHGFYEYEDYFGEYATVAHFTSLVGIYATHSNWTFEGVLALKNRNGNAVFQGWLSLLSKFNIASPPEEWAYYARYISFPGGLYHDFSFVGMLVFALIHGFCIATTKSLFINFGINILTSGAYLLVSIVTFASPFIVAVDVLMFPPLVFCIPLVFIISVVLKKYSFVKFTYPRLKVNER